MTIHDQMFVAASQPVLESQHGETITYAGGSSVTAVVTADKMERRKEPTGIVVVFTRMATIAISELGGSKPKVGMKVTIDDNTYDVENVSTSGSSVTLSLARYQIRTRSHANYHGP